MINASGALEIILGTIRSLPTERVPLSQALGRTLARDIAAGEDSPQFDNSSMDGFAVRASSLRDATNRRPRIFNVIGESSAGRPFDGTVHAGEAVRIMTGAALPSGADAVVPIERSTMLDHTTVSFSIPVKRWQHVRKRGEDVESGAVVLHSGRELSPGAIGLLASLGHTKVRVFRRPNVSIMATGNELVASSRKPGWGKVRDSSSYALAAFVADAGAKPRVCGIAPDDRRVLQRWIRGSLSSDVLLITGGVSVGKYDHVKEVLSDIGVQIRFWKINIKPGMPLVFGTYGKTLVFGLPGNPVSTAVTFMQFVRPALLRLAGREFVDPMRLRAVIDHSISKTDGKRHFIRGVLRRTKNAVHVTTTGTQSSGAVSSLAKANCLIVIPEKTVHVRRGETVEIELLQHTTPY